MVMRAAKNSRWKFCNRHKNAGKGNYSSKLQPTEDETTEHYLSHDYQDAMKEIFTTNYAFEYTKNIQGIFKKENI